MIDAGDAQLPRAADQRAQRWAAARVDGARADDPELSDNLGTCAVCKHGCGLTRMRRLRVRCALHHCRRRDKAMRHAPRAERKATKETNPMRTLFKALTTLDRIAGRQRRARRLSRAAHHADRALGRGRRHRRGGAHPGHADGKRPRPADQRGQPHRRLRCRGPSGDLGGAARWLHHRHHHGGDRHDAPPGPHRPEGLVVHADRAGQRRPRRHAGARRCAVQERQRAGRGDQGQPRQVQGLGHRPGRHLAPGDRRLPARPEGRPGGAAMGADPTAPHRA